MATPQLGKKSLWRLAYGRPRKTDPNGKPFDPPGPWFDATVVALALVLGIGLLI